MKTQPLTLALALPLLMAAQPDKPEPELKEYRPKGGGFSIRLPGEPKEQIDKRKGPERKDITVHVFVVEHKPAAYSASYTIDPGLEKIDDVKDKLRRIARGVEANMRGKPLAELKDKTLDGKYPGFEAALQLSESRVYRYRLFIVRDRLYQVAVLGPRDVVESGASDQVLDSLKLVNE